MCGNVKVYLTQEVLCGLKERYTGDNKYNRLWDHKLSNTTVGYCCDYCYSIGYGLASGVGCTLHWATLVEGVTG